MVFGFLICSFFTILTGLSIAEICSSYPSRGSVYHWTGMLATQSISGILSYLCGWLNLIGNVTGDACFAYACSRMIASCVEVMVNTHLNDYIKVGIAIGIALIWSIKSFIRSNY